MIITCPHCRFERNVDTRAIPPRAILVRCPRCGERFPLPTTPPKARVRQETVRPVEPAAQPAPVAAVPAARPAGFGLRLVAQLIDLAAFIVLHMVLALGLGLLGILQGGVSERVAGMTVGLALFVLASFWGLFVTVLVSYCGQTPGKMVTRLRVEGDDGSDVGVGTAFLREVVAKPISALLLMTGFLMILFDQNHQGLHDRIAHTRVVKL
ncbi:MAG: hypothetical protein D6751_00310 [Deltaproteobacteria bacterium]|nr:MAG: hypothetical protein D6751_00310 [Deltaproteobacteria bacterium]